MPLARSLLATIAVLLMLVSAAPGAAAQVEGSHWTSPTYGFRVSWLDTPWQVDPDGSLTAVGPERLDRLHLVNGASSLYVEGATRYAGNLSSCVAEEANILAQESGVSDIRPYRDQHGAPFVADGPNASAAAFTLTLEVGQQQIELVNYVECRTLIPGEAVLIITLVTDPDTFESELQAAQPVMDSITPAEAIPLSPLAAYGGWIAAAQARPSIAGPLSGEIAFGPGVLGVERTGVDAPDFYARAAFSHAEPATLDAWDFGLGFRDSGGEEQWRLIVDSAGTWFLKDGLGPVIASGSLVDIDTSASGTNIIELVAVGDTGYFAFNERLVTELDLSSREHGGNLFAGAGFFREDATAEGTTAFSQLEVWSLSGLEAQESVAPAAAIDAAAFPTLVTAATSAAPLAGPDAGELVQTTGAAAIVPAGVDVEDFVARATFINPDTAAEQPWDVGIAFREQRSGDHYRITVGSDGRWEFQIGLQSDLAGGAVPTLNLAPGGRNTIEVVVAGDAAAFSVNGAFVSQLDTSRLHGAGDVWLGAGFHRANVSEGEATRFEGFTVWAFAPEGVAPDGPVATPETRRQARNVRLASADPHPPPSGCPASPCAQGEGRVAAKIRGQHEPLALCRGPGTLWVARVPACRWR